MQKGSASLYSNFILDLYVVYELNNWPCYPKNNFPVKNCLFGKAKLVKNAIKSKFTSNGLRIAIEGERSWSFGNDLARNVAIFGVDYTSSSRADNQKITF